MLNVNEILKASDLARLIQPDFFVGWAYAIDYEFAHVMTNDLWKHQALGIPHNCFLVAASFNPDEMANVPAEEQEVILLRVVGSAKLPQDDDMVRTKIDHFKDQKNKFGTPDRQMDDITQNELQFGGLKCRVLGTFFVDKDELWLGSDLESFATATRLNVYRPHDAALAGIVNYVDPIRRAGARETAEQLGLKGDIKPFQVGTVRYTSTDRLHRRHPNAKQVPVFVQPADFLARRTAVLGMTRTGKSNMIKQMVSVVKRVADESGAKIGQIIYDLNGEYANANQQDKGALADIYPDATVRYRMLKADGFQELQNNFYVQLNEGFATIKRMLGEIKGHPNDVSVFLNTAFDEPDKTDDEGQRLHKRWRVRTAIYRTMLHMADFPAPDNFRIYFDANQLVRDAIQKQASVEFPDPKHGLTLDEAVQWFIAARDANKVKTLMSSTNKPWFDEDSKAMLNMMKQRNDNETFIKGYKILADVRGYHSPRRSKEVGAEVYSHLVNGKIVILDLSVGDASLRDNISKQIAQTIFEQSMQTFIKGKTPPNIVVYIEEAHNLIGKGMDLTETWPRLAKEGAKYRISLVYATQEVSSMHPNILANTENWFITHLNNAREIKELAQFYDFEDFSDSLIRAQDIGFARVKTLSSPFVIPVQIDKFDPEAERNRVAAAVPNPRLL